MRGGTSGVPAHVLPMHSECVTALYDGGIRLDLSEYEPTNHGPRESPLHAHPLHKLFHLLVCTLWLSHTEAVY